MNKSKLCFNLAIAALPAIILAGCSKSSDSDSTTDTDFSLSGLPDANELISSGSTSAAVVDLASGKRLDMTQAANGAVVGTPPQLQTITPATADTSFWNG